jgi:hypothetical protein
MRLAVVGGWRGRVVARWRAIRVDAADSGACENAGANAAADAFCICRCWSNYGSGADARNTDQHDERFVQVFSLTRPGLSRDAASPRTSPLPCLISYVALTEL